MRLSYNDLWTEAVGLVRSNSAVLTALAGAFFFLPNLVTAHFAPFDLEPAPSLSALVDAVSAHVRRHWPLILAVQLFEIVGTLTMLRLFLKADGRTVAAAILASLALLPTQLVAGGAANLMIVLGLVALIVPGVYLIGRLAPLPAVIVAETVRNPFAAIGRTFAVTRGAGFAIAGILIIVLLVALLIGTLVSSAAGAVGILIAGRGPGVLLANAAGGLVSAAAAVLLVALVPAWHDLRGGQSP